MYDKQKIEAYQNFGGINEKYSEYTKEATQFLDLRNYMFEKIGSLTSRPGTESHLTLPVSQFINKPQNSYQYNKENGETYLMFDSGQTLYAFGTSLLGVDGNLSSSPTTSVGIDFVTAKDTLYYATGDLKKFNGSLAIKVSLSDIDAINPNNVTFNTGLAGATATIPQDDYYFRAAWLRGTPSLTDGKINEFFTVNLSTKIQQIGGGAEDGLSLFTIGATIQAEGKWLLWGLSAPAFEGVSSIAVAYSRVGAGITNFLYSSPLSFYQTLISGVTTWATEFEHFSTNQGSYTVRAPVVSKVERLSYFNNMLVASNDDSISISNLDDIEAFPPENVVNIITNPEDEIVVMVPFQDALVVFKQDSIHEITGQSPDTISLNDVTFDFGCVSPKGFCVFENRLFFADKKGIAEYLGTNTKIVSNYIEPTMDLVDKTVLTGLHVKKHNQVWFGDGDVIYVYDYVSNAWTYYDNLPVDKDAGLINYKFSSSRTDPFYWQDGSSYHLGIRFGDSLATDLGSAITLSYKTIFHSRFEKTTQEMWRRLFINSEPGTTLGATVNFYPDYGSSIYLTRSMPLSKFQERIDYGVSGKSLSHEVIIQSSTKVVINGYTIESRYLRSV